MNTQSNATQPASMATHTPTPWSIAYYSPTKEVGDQSAFIIMPEFGTMNEGKAVCSGHGPDHKANAAFIVRACNSHAQLVAALEATATILEANSRMLTMLAELIADGPHASKGQFISLQCATNRPAITQARAILTAAQS